MPAERCVKIPEGVTDQQAASMMLKGMTAQYLLRRTYRVKPGDIILNQAAAGGVGQILGQWAKHLGATVIGTVGSDDKVALAKANGCDHVINYRTEDWVKRVLEITNGKKCQVVYDGVGNDTFLKSLDCIAPLGMMVSFGAASGPVAPFYTGELAAKGSLYLTRPTLDTYTATRADLVNTAGELFDVVAKGIVKVTVNQTYPLQEAAQAHRDLESRKTTGSTVFLP
jgi:NADPH2:quinone reductase